MQGKVTETSKVKENATEKVEVREKATKKSKMEETVSKKISRQHEEECTFSRQHEEDSTFDNILDDHVDRHFGQVYDLGGADVDVNFMTTVNAKVPTPEEIFQDSIDKIETKRSQNIAIFDRKIETIRGKKSDDELTPEEVIKINDLILIKNNAHTEFENTITTLKLKLAKI